MRFTAAASALMLTVPGCSGDGEKPDGRKPAGGGPVSEKPIASEPMEHEDGPAHVDLLAVDRTAQDTVTVRLRIVNDGQRRLRLLTALKDMAPNSPGSELANGIALVDGVGDKVYYPMTTSTGSCLCSDVTNVEVAPGKPQELYAVYADPRTTRVTLSVPDTVQFADVPIGVGQAPPAPGQSVDPAKVSLGQPNVRSLVNSSESAVQDVDDDDNDRTMRLSADVLFAYDKAVLTSKASGVLRGVAQQIDRSRGDTIKIDGYTDNTGTDAVNQPLSEQRAQAMQDALKSLVTRQGLTFQSAGHGSQNPVAKNDDESGRKRNRRVTVAFAKPPEPQTTAPSAGPAFRWSGEGRLPVLATARPNFHADGNTTIEGADNLRFDVNSLHRESSGLVTLVWTVTDIGAQDQMIGGSFDKWLSLEYPGATTTSGAGLVDRVGQMRYWPSRDGQGVCVCSSTSEAVYATQILHPKSSVTYSGVYKPPVALSRMDVQISWFAEKIDVGGVPVR
ncbi:OmpA family protein [Actinoallomurus sp. NPDC050550]|uniref:OmpA family protein n=1 Tax=Actinoallomurus sp. NPDC050550 TaxID=3154937 RepID=UPI0034014C42